MIDAKIYREGMSRVAGAVHIIATDGAIKSGATAIAVASVSDNPAELLVCLNAMSNTAKAIIENEKFTVNCLAEGDLSLADVFAGHGGLTKFEHGSWEGARLKTSLVSFECEVISHATHATHEVFFGRVVSVVIGDKGKGLVFRNREYGVV